MINPNWIPICPQCSSREDVYYSESKDIFDCDYCQLTFTLAEAGKGLSVDEVIRNEEMNTSVD